MILRCLFPILFPFVSRVGTSANAKDQKIHWNFGLGPIGFTEYALYAVMICMMNRFAGKYGIVSFLDRKNSPLGDYS